jgi:hypothetical protein
MSATILKLVLMIASSLRAEGAELEAYQVDQICGEATVHQYIAEMDYIVPFDTTASRFAVEFAYTIASDEIVFVECDDSEYQWEVKN